ncbi:MAG: glycosyltransferase family 9 protein, partial [Anaerolineae bacterium]
IAVLTSKIGKEVLQLCPYVDEIFSIKDKAFLSLFLPFFFLKRKKIDAILLFHASQRAILPFCAFLGSEKFIGIEGLNKGLDSLLSKTLPNSSIHEIERRLAMAAELGAHISTPSLEFFFNEEDQAKATAFLQSLNLPSYIPLVGIHPGAKDFFKQWNPDHFIALGNRLVDHLGCQIIVTGSRTEAPLVQKVASGISRAKALAGELPVRSTAALIKKMALFISNDTGPMHLAFAVQTPTVALFTPTDPKLCGPYFANQVKVIQKRPTCNPCMRKECLDPFCLLQIGIDEVYEEALDLYYRHKGQR